MSFGGRGLLKLVAFLMCTRNYTMIDEIKRVHFTTLFVYIFWDSTKDNNNNEALLVAPKQLDAE